MICSNIFILHRIVANVPQSIDDISINTLELWLEQYSHLMPKIGSCIDFENPDWKVLLTFDDGYKSDYEKVVPLLKKYNVNALFFIIPSYLGKKNYLSANQLQHINEMGFTIGSHSLTHPDFSNLNTKEVRNEMRNSKSELENLLNLKIQHFAFPYGNIPFEFDVNINSDYTYYFGSKPGIYESKKQVFHRNALNAKSYSNSIELIAKSLDGHLSIYLLKYRLKEFLKNLLPRGWYRWLRRLL